MTHPTVAIAMPGMGNGSHANNQLIVSAFHSALLRQGLIVGVIVAVVLLAWNLIRRVQLSRPPGAGTPLSPPPEPVARRFLRVCFGLIWIFDGILQGQAAMPLGLVPQVIQPATAGSPAWVHDLVNAATSTWSLHPVTAAAAAVWIQVGIGLWLLAAPRGRWSRLAGLASVVWGFVIWVFGEALGGILAPGLTVLFGAPGAGLLYCLAGALIALPERSWGSATLRRGLIRVTGLFLVAMAVLQAWPNRGFWQGATLHAAHPGTLTAMVRSMAATPQPGWLASWVAAFASFDAAHGWGVNLFVVISMAAIGLALLTAHHRVVLAAVAVGVLFCLADWVLVEDLGFLGGLGTDPNSMIPLAVVLVAAYLALVRVPEPAGAPLPTRAAVPVVAPLVNDGADEPQPSGRRWWRDRIVVNPTYALRCAASLGAIAITAVGAAPMAVAATDPNPSPILAQALSRHQAGAALQAGPTRVPRRQTATVALGPKGALNAMVTDEPCSARLAEMRHKEATQCRV